MESTQNSDNSTFYQNFGQYLAKLVEKKDEAKKDSYSAKDETKKDKTSKYETNKDSYSSNAVSPFGGNLILPEDEEFSPWFRKKGGSYGPRGSDASSLLGMYNLGPRSPAQAGMQYSPLGRPTGSELNYGGRAPMQRMSRTKDGQYASTGHNIDVAIQYVAPDGGRYNMQMRTQTDNPGEALYAAMIGFYSSIAAGVKVGDYAGGAKAAYGGASKSGSSGGK